MDFDIVVESLPLLGVCNLCLNEGAVQNMLLAHKHNGRTENYSDMLLKCFSINILKLNLGDMKRLICSQCIAKLRDSAAFRNQVDAALSTLEVSLNMQKVAQEIAEDVKDELIAKNEAMVDDDFDSELLINDVTDNDSYENDETALKLLIKEETREGAKKIQRKSTKKYITLTVKKSADMSETETMLMAGLFPFKIRSNSLFSCSICPEKSTNLEDIRNHIVDHDKANIHVAFKKMMFSKSHRFYKFLDKLRCKLCTTDVSNYDELRQHTENCARVKYGRKWNKLPFKLEKDQLDCPVCKKTFLNYVSLNTHMNVHYPNYICENCGKAFASKSRLRGHMRTHEVGTFPCRYCNAVFDRVTKRENHVSKEHKAGVRYACKRCNISLSSFYARQKHLAEIHNEELKRYKCKACPQSYITPGHLSSHVRRDHLNERNHKCEKCDLAFYTKNALKMHMIKHDGERIHTCPVCQKAYQRKKTLREHMRIHNNDKRFVCPVCGRAFTQKCTLKGHLKVHESEKKDDSKMQPLHSI